MKIKLLLFLGLGLTLSSCFEEGNCLESGSNILKIKFIDATDGSDLTLDIQAITMDGSEVLYYEGVSTNAVDLPMNPGADSTTVHFIFSTDNQVATFEYEAYPQIIALDCGIDYDFQKLDTSSTSFDNLKIVNTILNQSTTTNVEIRR